uniref:NADH dehydrogenase subunit 5 n=1 Tax=Strongyloides venezuelensis TaxID=75913 RepID=A0A0K0EU04_STRVS
MIYINPASNYILYQKMIVYFISTALVIISLYGILNFF